MVEIKTFFSASMKQWYASFKKWGFFYRWPKIGNNGYFWPRKWNRQPILGALLRTCSSTWAAYRFRKKTFFLGNHRMDEHAVWIRWNHWNWAVLHCFPLTSFRPSDFSFQNSRTWLLVHMWRSLGLCLEKIDFRMEFICSRMAVSEAWGIPSFVAL